MTRFGNHGLDKEININLGRHVKGQIRGTVDTKYADLEKLLSSNLGEKLKEVCDIQSKPAIPPRPHSKSHQRSVHTSLHQYSTLQHSTVDEAADISI